MAESYDTHSIYLQRAIEPEQRAAIEAEGWTLYSIVGPASPTDRQHGYHFRRARDRAAREDAPIPHFVSNKCTCHGRHHARNEMQASS
jgi:hypothetical protein